MLVVVFALGAGQAGDRAAASDPIVATRMIRVAQSGTPAVVVEGPFRVEPGKSARMPVRISERQLLDPLSHVIVRGMGEDVALSKGETIGNGVWLISVWELLDVELRAKGDARGPKDVVFTLVAPNGKPLSETKASLQVTSAAADAPKTAPAQPQAKAPQPAPAPVKAASAPPQPVPATPPTAARSTMVAAAPAGSAQEKSEQQLVNYARHLVRECTTCHSLYGHDQGIPLMIGLPKDRFLDTMRLYKEGRRDNGAMISVAQTLNDEQMLALALYLGRIKPPPQPVGVETRETSTPTLPIQIKAGGPPERAERWVTRGKQLFDTGDVAQARLLFEKAAETGHSRAAFLLGTTFDPNVLPWRPALGLEAQPAKAKQWYLLAKQLGAGAEVDQRLAELP
jgi:cytochrome c553